MTDPAQPTAELEVETLRDDALLRVFRRQGMTDRLVLCFSSVGRDPAEAPPIEWQRLAGRNPADHLLFLADPKRSWLNRPGLIEEMVAAIEAEAARVQARRIAAIGLSLGAFSALVLPGFTRIDSVMALSPQYSVDPSVLPMEKRWMNYREAIAEFRIRNASLHFVPECRYFVFVGDHPVERFQRRLMQPLPNLDCYVMKDSLHNTHIRLRQNRLLDPVIDACLDGDADRVRALMAGPFGPPLGAQPRQSFFQILMQHEAGSPNKAGKG